MPTEFIKVKPGYYPVPVWEFNIPAGYTCCGAGDDCKTLVHPETHKFLTRGKKYICYAAQAEIKPNVATQRWRNFKALLDGDPIAPLPAGAGYVRIHGSGDFFSQDYFDMWVDYVKNYPEVVFWAFTKALNYWVKRKSEIPENLVLIASKGSVHDELITKELLRYAEVFDSPEEVEASGLRVDYDDSLAFGSKENIALLKKPHSRKQKLRNLEYIDKQKAAREEL